MNMRGKHKGVWNIGGYVSSIRKKLANLGVTQEVIDKAIATGQQIKNQTAPPKLNAHVKSRIAKLLGNPGDRCVLIRASNSNKVIVCTMKGYEALQANGQRFKKLEAKLQEAEKPARRPGLW